MPTPPPRLTAALADRYRLERELGQGGMATVYLAHDIRHDRRVAVKVLRPELAAVIGAERFLAEIKTTANLQHPHILSLFDSGEADGTVFYVMPYVEGESLRDRIGRDHQLPIDEALRIAREVADALQYAHGHGIIHRDIKPENILLHGGHALVADFGIALAVSRSDGGSRMTETGMSLGTPHYMSPEQAMGEREISARSDVYALGCVTYEMLTGEPPFTGTTAQAIVARVVTEQPRGLTSQRRTIPAHVEAAVLTALEKLPADRYATAAEFSAALMNPGSLPASRVATAAVTAAGSGRWRRIAAVTSGVALAAAALAAWGWLRPAPEKPVIRYSLGLPAGQSLRPATLGMAIALSPDGRRLAYISGGDPQGQIWLRDRDKLEAVALPGTAGAANLRFSPDGERIAFQAGATNMLKVVSVAGGPALTLVESGSGLAGGLAWTPDGDLLFDAQGGFQRISASGGVPELAVPMDTSNGEIGLAWPEVLPNGRALVFRARHSLDPEEFELFAMDFATKTRHPLMKGLIARYLSPGYLAILRADGTLLAAPFDQEALKLTGPAVPMVEGIVTKAFGASDLTVSETGTLAYVPGSASGGAFAEAIWVDRKGIVTPFNPPLTFSPSTSRSVALSPDGSRLAFEVVGTRVPDIWVKQLPSGPQSRLTFEGSNIRPAWSSDGRYLYFLSNRDSSPNSIWRQRADGSAPAESVFSSPHGAMWEVQASAREEWLLYRTGQTGITRDILAWRRGDSTEVPLLTSKFSEAGIALSPNGKWLAYVSDESGTAEVYVRPFPRTGDGRWQLSNGGGLEPRWSRSGRELFFKSASDQLMSVPVGPGPTFSPGQPVPLFTLPAGMLVQTIVPYYDVAPGDQRFLMVRIASFDGGRGAGQMVVVENWVEEVRKRLRGGK